MPFCPLPSPRFLGLSAALLALIVLFSVLSDYFFTFNTFVSIANDIPALAIMALAMTYVLLIAGIDLSVGSVMALSSALCAQAMLHWHWGFTPAFVVCLVCGALCGALTGLITVYGRLPSFIVSLGMLEVARGLAYWITDSRTQYIGQAMGYLSSALFWGVSPAFLLLVLLIGLGQLILSKSVFGRYMVGIGTNEEAMRLSGINTHQIKIAVFVLMGLAASLSGLIQASRLEAADPNAGVGIELQVIAAVVIGGTRLMGGHGSVLNTCLGVLIIAVLEAGMAQMGVSDPSKRIMTGLVIIGAVLLDQIRLSKAGRSEDR